jgi:AcrR family transcriptional regulator
MNTREKILVTTLQLFNEEGIDVITIRQIAKEMDISHSNIQYYFKNADEIIATIYQNHLIAFNELTTFKDGENSTLDSLRQSTREILSLIYNYRFIYIYFVAIVRRMPDIKAMYKERYVLRREQFLELFDLFRKKGLFRNDIPEPVWESLIRNIYTVGDFWISANELTTGYKGQKAIDYYSSLIDNILYPYLTAKGRKQMADV